MEELKNSDLGEIKQTKILRLDAIYLEFPSNRRYQRQ